MKTKKQNHSRDETSDMGTITSYITHPDISKKQEDRSYKEYCQMCYEQGFSDGQNDMLDKVEKLIRVYWFDYASDLSQVIFNLEKLRSEGK